MATHYWFVLACALTVAGVGTAQSIDRPKPEMFNRAEDRMRAQLLGTPCTEADLGRGCRRVGDRLIRDYPCSIYDDPRFISSLPTDHCYKMGEPQRFSGVWIDEFEGQEFIPDGVALPELPQDRRSPEFMKKYRELRAASIWLDVDRAGLGYDFNNGTRRVHVQFIGRKAVYPWNYGHMGAWRNYIIVDRVISHRKLK
jgi:hypothetical protein